MLAGGYYINASYVESAVGEVPSWRFIATQVCGYLVLLMSCACLLATTTRLVKLKE